MEIYGESQDKGEDSVVSERTGTRDDREMEKGE
jgi:hypothetical protein